METSRALSLHLSHRFYCPKLTGKDHAHFSQEKQKYVGDIYNPKKKKKTLLLFSKFYKFLCLSYN